METNYKTKYCRHCGKQIDEKSQYCTYCGKSQDILTKSSETNNEKMSLSETINYDLSRSHNSLSSKNGSSTIKSLWQNKVIRFFLIIILLACLIPLGKSGYKGYHYYKNTYLPEKRLNEVVDSIVRDLNSDNDTIKIETASKILRNDTEWNIKGVNKSELTSRLDKYIDTSFKFIESKSFAGNCISQFRLGRIYTECLTCYKCSNVKKDNKKAAYWYNEAAKQGDAGAYNNLAVCYMFGMGVEKDQYKAVEYFKKSAELGNDVGQRNYGYLFKEGVFVYNDYTESYDTLVPKDIEQAKYWWRKSAKQGNKEAKEKLQQIFE